MDDKDEEEEEGENPHRRVTASRFPLCHNNVQSASSRQRAETQGEGSRGGQGRGQRGKEAQRRRSQTATSSQNLLSVHEEHRSDHFQGRDYRCELMIIHRILLFISMRKSHFQQHDNTNSGDTGDVKDPGSENTIKVK